MIINQSSVSGPTRAALPGLDVGCVQSAVPEQHFQTCKTSDLGLVGAVQIYIGHCRAYKHASEATCN